MNKQKKQLDSYSLLIVSKYFQYKEDYLNVIQVCKKFEETLDKFRRITPREAANLQSFKEDFDMSDDLQIYKQFEFVFERHHLEK